MWNKLITLASLGSIWVASAISLPLKQPLGLGLEFDQGPNTLPILKLDYSAYRAREYDSKKDVSYGL
jgi:hypothetical protein